MSTEVMVTLPQVEVRRAVREEIRSEGCDVGRRWMQKDLDAERGLPRLEGGR